MINELKRYNDDMHPLSIFSDDEIAEALRTVINYMITSAFDLTQKESTAVNRKLRAVTEDIFVGTPHSVPVAVLQELNTRYYSHALLNKRGGTFVVSPTPQKADVLSWVDIFIDMATSAYDLKSLEQAKLYVTMMDLMSEIGVRDKDSRTAYYLPNPVKNNLPD